MPQSLRMPGWGFIHKETPNVSSNTLQTRLYPLLFVRHYIRLDGLHSLKLLQKPSKQSLATFDNGHNT